MHIKYTVRFFLNDRFKEKGKYKIYGRISYKRKKSEFATNLWLEPEKWNQEFQVAIKSQIIDKQLKKIETEIENTVSHLFYEKKHIDAKSIKDYYVGNEVLDIGIIEYINKVVSEKRKIISSKDTPRKYVLLGDKVTKYIKSRFGVTDVNIKKVDYQFITGFDTFLKTIITSQYDKPLEQSTINRTHGFFSAVLNQAYEEEYIKRQPYKRFRLKKVVPKIKYLTKNELIRLENLDLSYNRSLDIARDTFVLSVYTGLRYSDTQLIRMDNLSYEKGIPTSFYLKEQKKTRNSVENPLFPQVVKLINKYLTSVDRNIENRIIPKSLNHTINRNLKIIAKLAQINKTLIHHMARHTCATTVLLENGVTIEEVKEWLGHVDISSTMVYAKVTSTQKRKTLDRLMA